MRSARLVLLALPLAALGCQKSSAPAAPAAPVTTTQAARPASTESSLPDVIPGFEAGPLERTAEYQRRTYSRGSAQVSVTFARFPMSPTQYQDWVRMSTGNYPQATLEVPPDEGNGFYQCADDKPERCDLLIQFRSGVHVEIRGNQTATRADADAVAHGLRLCVAAGTCGHGP